MREDGKRHREKSPHSKSESENGVDDESSPVKEGGYKSKIKRAIGKYLVGQYRQEESEIGSSDVGGDWNQKIPSDYHHHHHHYAAVSDSSSERRSRDSINPKDSSLISRFMCPKYVNCMNPYKFIKQFGNYEGHEELATGDDKRNFFCLVMILKCVQLLIIAGFISLPSFLPPLQDFLSDTHRYWTCIPFGLSFFIVLTVRMCPSIHGLHPRYSAAMFWLVTLCYAYIMSSLAAYYNSHVIKKVFWLLPATILFIAIFAFTMNISVVKKMIYISALSSVIFFATAMALLPPVYEGDSSFELSVDIWLPAVIATEILIFLLVFEFQSILRGERGRILKNDIWYVSLYL